MNISRDFKVGVLGAGTVGLTFAACFESRGVDYKILAKKIPDNPVEAFIHSHLIILPQDRFISIYDENLSKDFDLIVSTVKRYDLSESVTMCDALLKLGGSVLSVQNGIYVREEYGTLSPRVIHAPIFLVSEITNKNIMIHKIPEIVLPININHQINSLLVDSGIKAVKSPDIDCSIWKKIIFVSSISGICSLFDADVKGIKLNQEYSAMFQNAVFEAVHVATKEGILFETDAWNDAIISFENLPAHFRPSMAYDFIHRRRSEVNWLSGIISHLGKIKSVPVPTHDRIFETLRKREMHYVPWGMERIRAKSVTM